MNGFELQSRLMAILTPLAIVALVLALLKLVIVAAWRAWT